MSLSFPKACLPAVVFALSASAGAAEWSMQPSVDSEIFYDSNIVLGTVIEEEVEGLSLTPRLNLRGRTATWQTDLNIALPFNFLSNDLYDSDDQIVGLNLARTGEKHGLYLNTEVRRESTRTAAPELGFVVAATRTEKRSLRPSWSWILNEKNSIQLGGNWLEAEYDTPRFSDYEQYGFDATWIRQLDERLGLQVAVYNSTFETGVAPFNSDSDTLGLSIGLTRQFDERLTGSITAGARRSDTTTRTLFFIFPITVEDESTGFTADASMQYTDETWTGAISLSRALSPDAFAGELLETDRFKASYSRRLRETLYFDFSVDFVSSETLGDSGFSREYWYATPALRWQFAERWTFSTTLRHRIREAQLGGRGSDAEGTAIFFRLRYAHPRASW